MAEGPFPKLTVEDLRDLADGLSVPGRAAWVRAVQKGYPRPTAPGAAAPAAWS